MHNIEDNAIHYVKRCSEIFRMKEEVIRLSV